jgi:NADH-quinone oxidoreductase subunit A
VFLIFDVEVAFFFPWAVVFGTSARTAELATAAAQAEPGAPVVAAMNEKYSQLTGDRVEPPADAAQIRDTARRLTVFSLLDLLVFFAVLLVGFAYVWNQGDLDWVRAVERRQEQPAPAEPPMEVSLR